MNHTLSLQKEKRRSCSRKPNVKTPSIVKQFWYFGSKRLIRSRNFCGELQN